MRAIKPLDRASALTDYFSPKVIGEVDDVFVKVAKIKGDEIPWHNHAGEDELFYILDGSLLFEIEGEEPFTMETGELFIVRRGVNHRVSSAEECSILLVENKSTAHLGDTESEITKSVVEQLGDYGSTVRPVGGEALGPKRDKESRRGEHPTSRKSPQTRGYK